VLVLQIVCRAIVLLNFLYLQHHTMTIILADLPSVTSSFITIPYPTNQQEFCLFIVQ
jgi:hypothetical protein